VLSPVIGLFCHRRRRKLLSADLTPGSGRQDHTPSPSASVPFIEGTSTSTATQPHVRDDRETPLLSGRDGETSKDDLPDGASGIFFREGSRQQFADLVVVPRAACEAAPPASPNGLRPANHRDFQFCDRSHNDIELSEFCRNHLGCDQPEPI